MALSDKEVKDFEDKYKKGLLDKIIEVSLKQTKLNSQIEQFEEYMGLDPNLPNISITLNNKLVELQHQFEDAGISMYATKIENYGPLHQNFIISTFIGEAVIQDLISLNGKGIQDLTNYSRSMSDISKPKIEKAKALEKASTLRKFFLKIRSLFAPMKQQAISYTKEEKDILNSHMSEYKNTDEQLYNYNLRDNVVSSIVKYVREQGYAAYIVPGLLERLIADDLQKLGLGDLIPELQSSLIEEYKKDLQGKIKTRKEAQAKAQKESQAIEQLIANTEVNIPDGMIDDQVHQMLHEFEHNLSYQGLTLDIYCKYINTSLDEFKETLRPQAINDIKLKLALEFIAKQENVKVEESEIDEKIEELAKQYGSEDANSIKSNESARKYMEEKLKQDKTMEIVTNNVVEK